MITLQYKRSIRSKKQVYKFSFRARVTNNVQSIAFQRLKDCNGKVQKEFLKLHTDLVIKLATRRQLCDKECEGVNIPVEECTRDAYRRLLALFYIAF